MVQTWSSRVCVCDVVFGSLKGCCEKVILYIAEVFVQCFQLSEVSVCKATEVELLTWVEGTQGWEEESFCSIVWVLLSAAALLYNVVTLSCTWPAQPMFNSGLARPKKTNKKTHKFYTQNLGIKQSLSMWPVRHSFQSLWCWMEISPLWWVFVQYSEKWCIF